MVKSFLRAVPFIIILFLLGKIYFFSGGHEEGDIVVNKTTILNRVEALGKLELVKYSFKEVTELTEMSEEYFDFFKMGPDSKIALISTGYAVGCLDLTSLKIDDMDIKNETIYVQLPAPELCYYKLDLENTSIFSFQSNPLKDESEFIQKAYKNAEKEIKDAALSSGIMEQTQVNAELILRPMLEEITGKNVVFTKKDTLDILH